MIRFPAMFLVLVASGVATAAPPTLTYLYPAGAQRGTTVEVTAAGTFERWPVRVWIDAKGVEVQPGRDKGKLTVRVATDATPGTYWLRLHDDEGATALRPFIVGTLPEVMEQEPNDDFKKPQTVDANGVTVNGRLEKPGDVDCFALPLRQGQTLVASLLANRTLGSPMDATLQVVSADGFVLEQNDDYHGLDPQLAFTAPKDGTYVVRTFAFPSVPDASIRFAGAETFVYRLTLTTRGFADHAFPLAVSRAEPGQVELVGWNIPEAARKVNADQSPVFHADVANPVDVRREPHPCIVSVKPNDRQHPQAIVLPVTISGRLEGANERHVYQFDGKKGQKLQFQAEAQALGFLLSPVLRLIDAAGKTLAQAEPAAPGRDPALSFAVPADGRYQIELRDLHAHGGPRHVYRLRAVLAEPDFALTLAADSFVLVPGKPLDIPVTVERRNGFAPEIELVAEGLPDGVTAATVPGATGAKAMTLRLTGGTAVASVPLRIVGRAKGMEDPTRPALATLAGLNASTENLWLTVTEKK